MSSIGPVMLDVQGTELTQEDIEILNSPSCGGLILFARNFKSAQQVFELTRHVKAINSNVIIAVDQEGGRVQRFKHGFSELPALANLGELYQQDPQTACQQASYQGELMALEVQSVGCDISFAPVLDLGNKFSRVIGDRGFSTEPDVVIAIATAYINGMQNAGMAATAKHFPGHGSIEADSHVEMPIDDRQLDEIMATDLRPFEALKDNYSAIMPAHIVFPKIDSESAGFSTFWIKEVLRKRIGFQGAVFSDDLSMKGAEVAGDFINRAERALKAGCDMVLVCNDRQAVVSVVDYLDANPNAPVASHESSERLASLLMKQQPIGLTALKQTERWQFLNQELIQFKQNRAI
ncbi:beta-N-acetylhexosaminidase [Aliikangiella marina]|uniref:Beta-hexosaminidase n=1 Tax=Aliikangiella marina TaxID=1712262 RepID=A0A545TIV7_9GAMM|nr:beta-N-acetylhexosaminidase [Aliikangiella marina]TQV77137.1 beta-N-acetylhexosaminidase [Aliikangiella marina]